MKIAMIGTRGVPAKYGGFETCVEEVGSRLVEAGHEVTVYCRTPADRAAVPKAYKGMRLVTLPALPMKTLETLSHSGLSVADVVRRSSPVDVALVFNAANAPLLPLLKAKGIPVATHVDGLEWQRAKWGRVGSRYYRLAERLSVRWSDALIADAVGIQDYYRKKFDVETQLISYGAPVVARAGGDPLAQQDLQADAYHLVVARFEPENHVDRIVEGYRRSGACHPLVVVGSAPYAEEYTRRIHGLADGRVRFLGSVWDQNLLDQLYANALTYVHGHSVGGTNPSLLRAVGASAPTLAFDVSFNREVLHTAGDYFTTPGDLASLLEAREADSAEVIAARRDSSLARARLYDWDNVATAYERLCARLVRGTVPAVTPAVNNFGGVGGVAP